MTGRGAGGQEQGARTFVLQEDGSRLGLSFSPGSSELGAYIVQLYSRILVLTDSGCGMVVCAAVCGSGYCRMNIYRLRKARSYAASHTKLLARQGSYYL